MLVTGRTQKRHLKLNGRLAGEQKNESLDESVSASSLRCFAGRVVILLGRHDLALVTESVTLRICWGCVALHVAAAKWPIFPKEPTVHGDLATGGFWPIVLKKSSKPAYQLESAQI